MKKINVTTCSKKELEHVKKVSDIINENISLKVENKNLKSKIKMTKDWMPIKDAPRDRVILTDKGFACSVVSASNKYPNAPEGQRLGWALCDMNGNKKYSFAYHYVKDTTPSVGFLPSFMINIGLKEPTVKTMELSKFNMSYDIMIIDPTVWREFE